MNNIDKQIREVLLSYSITTPVEIEEEAKPYILTALTSPDVDKVYVDDEGGLCIEYLGEE